MLEHQKLIIANVAKDKGLFEKEICKSLQWLNEEEKKELRAWLNEQFASTHKDLIEEIFTLKKAG